MIGKIVSHYRILERLGEGGMGEVYLAEDTNLGRRVAIKFPILTSNEHDYRARFLREARAISELSNPHIATLFDYGETSEGHPFLVMEFVRGQTLSALMRKGELSLPRALQIVEDVAAALSEPHARGIVHRDIKPSNIMINERGQIKVLDFGLAKQLNEDQIHVSEPEAQTLLALHTRSGMVVGTPAYLSPEQAIGAHVDPRSDLFALGGVLYECVVGRPAFPGKSVIEIAANVIHFEPVPPSKISPRVPPELDSLILKALAKKPEKRYQSADELIVDLRSVRDLLEDDSGQTLIKPRSAVSGTLHKSTLTNLSQILQRPRVPVWYILVGVVVVVGALLISWRWWRPPLHAPSAEAQNWYDIGTNALRDGAYYQASKALEQAIAIDDQYVLAHASLAESLIELDQTDRAKDELLRATSLASDRSRLPRMDALYVDAISATVRHDFPAAIESYAEIAKQSPDTEKPRVLVDLGRAYEKNEDARKAIESYSQATTRNAQYPTAFLRLGILYGRQQELANAMTAFDKAETLYKALANLEGRAEVAFQRGALFNKLNKMAEAKAQLEQALSLARAADNKSQVIKTLLQLSSVAVDVGETERATENAREAVDLAQKNGMENLSARGLTDLGNAFLIRGELVDAEKYLLQAIELAQRSRARSNEARARVSMASLRHNQNNPREVLLFLEPALAFYQQGGYRSETFSCLVLMARANRQKGDCEAALRANEQLLQLAQQSNDQSQLALAHTEMGSALERQGKYSEALDHYSQAFVIHKASGVQRSICNNLLSRGSVLWQLGQYQEAQSLLTEAAAIADKPDGGYGRISADIKLVEAEISLSQARFPEAKARAEKVLALTGTQFPAMTIGAKSVLGLAQAYGDNAASGKQTVAGAVEAAQRLNDPEQLAEAQFALAEALLLARDSQTALTNALEAQKTFTRCGQQGSEWRAWLIAALASRSAGDSGKAREYAVQSSASLSAFEQRLGTANFSGYLSRPDVQRLRKQLSEVSGSSK
jgi:tetratricopeptide (TPR) repeat protein/predicted Ser/Thr protein kinase